MAKARLIVLNVEDKPGTVAAAAGALSEAGVNIESILGWGPQGVVQLIVNDHRLAKKVLKAAGIEHSEAKANMVDLPNKPGSLHAYLSKLAKKGINLRSISGSASKSGRKSVVVWTAED